MASRAGTVSEVVGHGRDVAELRSHVAGEIVLGGHDVAGVGAAYDPVAQARLGLFDGGVGQARYEFQIDPAIAVEADVQRVVQAVGMGGHGRHRADGPLREAFRLADEPSFFIRLLQCHDEMAAGFLAAVGAPVGAVAQSSELAREPVVRPVEFGTLGFHVTGRRRGRGRVRAVGVRAPGLAGGSCRAGAAPRRPGRGRSR